MTRTAKHSSPISSDCCSDTRATADTYVQQLSDEDTEADAEKRAKIIEGNSNVVYRTERTTGFTFGYSESRIIAKFVACKGDYNIFLTYTKSSADGSTSGPIRTSVGHQSTETGEFTFDKNFAIGTDPCTEKNVTYTLLGVEAEGTGSCQNDASGLLARTSTASRFG